jgi:hypothetical protein
MKSIAIDFVYFYFVLLSDLPSISSTAAQCGMLEPKQGKRSLPGHGVGK